MTARIRERRPSTPAYYLGRPAGLWLAALAPRHGATGSPASQAAPRSYRRSNPLASGPRTPGMSGLTG